jgi:SAM-dependent methyltransferase
MEPDPRLRATFDQVATLYDEARPRYPEALIDDAIWLSGLPPGGRILEVGAGSGQATLPFARRDYAILCLELGPSLAALCAEHCRPYPRVEVQNVAFEDWPLQRGGFDLVLSAGSWDWIEADVFYPRAAAALRPGGALALLSNLNRGGDSPLFEAMGALRRRIAPELDGAARQRTLDELDREAVNPIQASGLFGEVRVRHRPWQQTYTADGWIRLLNTYSAVRSLPEARRRELLSGIQALIEQFGGTVETQYVSALYLAPLRPVGEASPSQA